MKSLFEILDLLATHHRKLVLMQDQRYWRIEDLFRQAARDAKTPKYRDAVLDRSYTFKDEDGKIVIRRAGQAIFYEPGWQQRS